MIKQTISGTSNKAFAEAQRRILVAKKTGAKELELVGLGLRILPASLAQLNQLQTLNLSANQLTALPEFLGQLRQLQVLHVYGNQLTSLPEFLGHMSQLKTLAVSENPLPAAILRLHQEGKLIDYLQSLPKSNKLVRFDEAKLLLVGPGEVGKSWLLQALQGRIPKEIGSTKGLEIARQQLDLQHPTQKERILHLNCWDFGGQNHYQITHQIFFSPQAIYLLVWKPRTGVDPDLVARIERIQLSAGLSARVFIVSTHADGSVPPVIGQDALRERFGDLIGGFHAIDSAKGPSGTGIAELKSAIAQAAAQLEGIDLLFLPPWHKAHKAVRALKKPTITFAEFEMLCWQHGVTHNDAAALASIMDVQGNAVYFADAPVRSESGVAESENLVVLNPEWLAKAVAFLIEDKDTLNESGVLLHKRLREIWKEDINRGCPGYAQELHGYLLWLIWKFDIAYKLNEETSLVPQLIHRNRPDDLYWTPAVDVPGGERQATLICRIPQTPPLGLIPVLTAAVHPLRRVQCPKGNGDKLDRNWRNGFFLDTMMRGSAFVELPDRDLFIIARDKYPSHLVHQIRKTLDQVAKIRWPHLQLNYCVPCVEKKDGKPCPGTFDWEWLEKRRGQHVACQKCGCDEVEVDKMLEGFDSKAEEVLHKLQQLQIGHALLLVGQSELKDGQSDLLAAALRLYRDSLDPARPELERAPCMFTILPEEGGWNFLARLTEVRINVTCWCEHPDGPHPGARNGSHQPPDYLLKMPRQWLSTVAPYISWAATIFKAFVPLVGTIVEQGLGSEMPSSLKDQIELMGGVRKALPAGKLELGSKEELKGMHRFRPEIVALRHIHDALEAQVPVSQRWGDLRLVDTKSGERLWLCAKHAAIQQPLPKKL